MHAAAWEAALEAHKVKEDDENEPSNEYLKWQWVTEKAARTTALMELARPRAEAAKVAMLQPASWRRYESTDGKIVWVFEGPVAFDYRINLEPGRSVGGTTLKYTCFNQAGFRIVGLISRSIHWSSAICLQFRPARVHSAGQQHNAVHPV